MLYWTMSYDGGVETALADYGIKDSFQLERTNKGVGTVTFETDEFFDPATLQFQFKKRAVFWGNRISADGSPGSFSGGQVVFIGYFDDPTQQTEGGKESVRYTIHNVWWLFERNYFKQQRNQFTGFDALHKRIQLATVAVGGSGYAVGDRVAVSGGSGPIAACTVAITAISGGGATGPATIVQVTDAGGKYNNATLPANPNFPTNITGTGSGLQLNLSFQQFPNTTPSVTSETFLGEGLNAAGYTFQWNDGDQIGEIFDWMNTSYNFTRHPGFLGALDPTQDVLIKGTIDPHTFMPISRVNTVFCAEAVQSCLRWEPDAVIVEDPTTFIGLAHIPTLSILKLGHWNYATVPPTFIDYNNPAIPAVSVNITATQERSIELAAARNKILPGVIIYYSTVNIVDNVLSVQLFIDKFGQADLTLPPSKTNIDDYTPEASTHFVELAGEKLSHVFGNVTSEAIANAVSGTASDRKTFWQSHDATLNAATNPKIDASSIQAAVATVVDDNGTPIVLANFPFILTSTLPGWVINANTVRAHISAVLQYKQFRLDAATNAVPTAIHDDTNDQHIHHFTAVLTNIPTGSYIAVSQFEQGELIPQGLAESAYRSLGSLRNAAGDLVPQFSGSIEFVDTDARLDIGIGNKLQLVGPNNTYQNLLVQRVVIHPHFGKTTVEYGTGTPIEVDQWIELARATRFRTIYNMPSGRADGQPSTDTQITTGAASHYWNIHHSTAGKQQNGGAAPYP